MVGRDGGGGGGSAGRPLRFFFHAIRKTSEWCRIVSARQGGISSPPSRIVLSFSSSYLRLSIILPFSRKGEDSDLHGFDTRLLLTPIPLSLSPFPPRFLQVRRGSALNPLRFTFPESPRPRDHRFHDKSLAWRFTAIFSRDSDSLLYADVAAING